ncbi:PEP/pyruvate-binding domain-containing protein [Lentzea flaviverrucosa]|uniref:Pyruvate, water dikinase n=1 Tax=Lentzea flaviverrucosa TaxID=200379 RepID=A0A1H9XWZ3_9PSEU|nr:PEP/pyruvate-binding domain-containing protein [Lentzea flaviverrucosa]RDI17461.1 pyruvate,water dikinase [Lentzea flaviverrucosa]SES50671.1 pyruvate, water dikinase [Lentzea flaviverrucosa]
MTLTIGFKSIDGTMLATVGGKAANLGELTRAGFPVPPGFCVTTDAYRAVAQADELARATPENARRTLRETAVPQEIRDAIVAEYHELGDEVPVAVRSSATAEDLPFASFAGQQDTFLNVVGEDEVVDAVRRCWASLWTDRAVSYRDTNGIDHTSTYLAVVVQRMVQSAVSGVMFTANPVTGTRDQIVIDASPGLGEAVVSGAVNPDHFVVDGSEIVEKRLGDKKLVIRSLPGGGTEHVEVGDGDAQCLTDGQIHGLAVLGRKVQRHYGSPQDVEWAIDDDGELHLTQARPITTLFPLPDNPDGTAHAYFCFSLAQGLERPITPMGRATFREISKSALEIVIGDPRSKSYVETGERIFFDVTKVLQSKVGREFVTRLLGVMEARSSEVLRGLFDDPRFAIRNSSPTPALKRVLRLARRFRVPVTAMKALVNPEKAVREALRWERQILEKSATLSIEQALQQCVVPVLPRLAPTALVGFAMLGLVGKVVRTGPGELQTVLRGLPNNVTTEMDMAMWALAQEIRHDPVALRRFQNGERPAALDRFLARWGHRAVAEIDLGLPRWSDEPAHVIGVIKNFLRLEGDQGHPDAVFARGAAEAEAMIETLARRARGRGWFVRFALRRTRVLAGLREYPKYLIITLFGALRKRVAAIGAELVAAGRLDVVEDVFFLSFEEMRSPQGDLRPVVAGRREVYDREMRRRHIPRVLLSDGTEPEAVHHGVPAEGDLVGTPASAGTVTGIARVVMDPVGAHLEPGEILVAPSTDPGWTPLFLTAGGLVMEMGGANSHGAVVAREYGIPAVVGVREAVTRIRTGERITVDGSTGAVITLESPVEVSEGRPDA